MQIPKQISFKLVTSFSLLMILNGCVNKNPDGTYTSTYSYHSCNKELKTINTKETQTQKKRFKDAYTLSNYDPFINKMSSSNSPLSQQIEWTAKSHLGKKYKWGATGPYTFDCSGFTSSVFKNNGIKLPRESKDQARVGKIVRLRELKKGDLIFFDSKKSSKVSHVGIYLEKGNFIHASSSKKGVIVSNLNSNYYSKHFKWGRRYL